MLQEFKKFISRGNVIDLAVGIIIGAAFSGVVGSLVNDIIMPPIGEIMGGVDFTDLFINLSDGDYDSLAEAQAAGAATINYGLFINTLINFLIVALAVFLLVRAVNRMMEGTSKFRKAPEVPGEPVNKECPYCVTSIPYKATRCPNCTSELSKAT
jgi:large conductance mechanosensitive channel